MSIEAVHGAHAPPADAHGHVHGHAHSHADTHTHTHSHDQSNFPAGGHPVEFGLAGPSSPLWWSAWQRLACAAALATGLWLVIAWAVR